MRKLASVQIVTEVSSIPNADKIEKLSVLGWRVVARKGEFKVGDKVVYVEIDSCLPLKDWSKFLWKKGDEGKPTYRLRTVKLRQQISQGLVLPITVLNGSDSNQPDVGTDVTKDLGITQYIPKIPVCISGDVKGTFPSFIPKTDETRIQSVPEVLKELDGKMMYISTKVDGTSGTYYFNQGDFGVCGRNYEFKYNKDNTFWQLATKYKIEEYLRDHGDNIAIQGEVAGPGIQGNPMQLVEHDFFVFNVYDIAKGRYFSFPEFLVFNRKFKFTMVPMECTTNATKDWTVDALLKLAEGNYIGTSNPREGIVIRAEEECYSEALSGRLSFKVINNSFLLKGGK